MANKTNLEYQSIMSKIEIIFRNMKELGVNTSDFENEVKNINDSIEEEVSTLDSTGYSQSNNYNRIYQSGIDKANKLLGVLEQYNKYYQAINKCYYVQGSQNTNEFGKDELGTVTDNIIELLTIIKSFDIVLENDNQMIERLYSVIYDVIKIEFLYNGYSKLSDYCKKSETDSSIISKFVIDDVYKLRESKCNTSQIDSIMIKIDSEGTYSSYLDDKLIQLICISKNKDKYLEELSTALRDIKAQLSNNKELFDSLVSNREREIYRKNDSIQSSKENNRDKTKEIIVGIIPTIVCLGVATGTYFGLSRALWGTEYKTETLTYSSATGKTVSSEEYYDKFAGIDGKAATDLVMIEVTNPWEKVTSKSSKEVYFERIIERTSIENLEYDDLSKYLDIDFENTKYDFKYSADVERKTELTAEDMYKDSSTEVIKIHQDVSQSQVAKSESSFDNAAVIVVSVFLSIVAVVITDLILLMISECTYYDYELFESLSNLFYELSDINYYKPDITRSVAKIKEITQKLNDIMESNSKLKQTLKTLLEKPEYRFLMSDRSRDISTIEKYIEEMEKEAALSLNKKM